MTEEELQVFVVLKIKTSPVVNLDMTLSKNANNKLCCSQTPKIRFLAPRPIYLFYYLGYISSFLFQIFQCVMALALSLIGFCDCVDFCCWYDLKITVNCFKETPFLSSKNIFCPSKSSFLITRAKFKLCFLT